MLRITRVVVEGSGMATMELSMPIPSPLFVRSVAEVNGVSETKPQNLWVRAVLGRLAVSPLERTILVPLPILLVSATSAPKAKVLAAKDSSTRFAGVPPEAGRRLA